jgi:hypothetical protein
VMTCPGRDALLDVIDHAAGARITPATSRARGHARRRAGRNTLHVGTPTL